MHALVRKRFVIHRRWCAICRIVRAVTERRLEHALETQPARRDGSRARSATGSGSRRAAPWSASGCLQRRCRRARAMRPGVRGSIRCRGSSTRASTARRPIASSPASSTSSRCGRRSSAFRRSGTAIRRPAGLRRSRSARRSNYRDERIVGDIKYLWEPSRHARAVDARAGVAPVAGRSVTPPPAARCWTRGSSSARMRAGRIGPAASSTRCA